MNEIDFKNWMQKNTVNPKVQSDTISRLKRLEKELGNIDLDSEFRTDKCNRILSLFNKTGKNA